MPARAGGYRVVARDVAASVGIDRPQTPTYGAVRADLLGERLELVLVELREILGTVDRIEQRKCPFVAHDWRV